MPLGVVTDSELEAELENSNSPNKVISGQVIDVNRGRGKGSVEVPNSLRKIIGETNELDSRGEAVDLASRFGISSSSVSAYANGATSTASYNDTPNKDHINDAKVRVQKRARHKLHKALTHLTDDKLAEAKAGEIASVAKSMSSIIKEMEPEKESGGPIPNGPTFIFYSPQVRNENQFEVIMSKDV
jgi:hypothetical protein